MSSKRKHCKRLDPCFLRFFFFAFSFFRFSFREDLKCLCWQGFFISREFIFWPKVCVLIPPSFSVVFHGSWAKHLIPPCKRWYYSRHFQNSLPEYTMKPDPNASVSRKKRRSKYIWEKRQTKISTRTRWMLFLGYEMDFLHSLGLLFSFQIQRRWWCCLCISLLISPLHPSASSFWHRWRVFTSTNHILEWIKYDSKC